MAIEELQNGRYKLLRKLGSGGMGEVYLMQDARVNRQVAIKVLRGEGASSPSESKSSSSARLFEREARAIAALDHPNILPLYDFGEEVLDDSTMTYMVMPFCVDGSLETWLKQRGDERLAPQQVAALIEQAAEGLQYAHEHQVIHLDVKPPNFLIRANRKDPLRPTLLLADFGISRNFTTVSSSSHTIRGTPAAMAPEQWSGEPVFASDQYALAIMTYEMLVGRPPFIGSMEQLMYRHFSVQPQPPSLFNPRLNEAIDAVLLRALSKKPEERYPAITDFASALAEAASQPPAFTDEDLAKYNTMTITPAEAEAGLSRMLTLTGGEEVSVQIPAGAQNGQILRLPRAGSDPDAPEMLLVNIAIQGTVTPARSSEDDLPDSQDAETAPSLKAGAEPARAAAQTPALPPQVASPATPVLAAPITPPASLPEQAPLHLAAAESSTPAEPNQPTLMSIGSPGQITMAPTPLAQPRRRFGVIALVSILLVVLILAGSIFFYATRQGGTASVQSTPTAGPTATPTATPTPSPTPVPAGLDIAGTYQGSMAHTDGSQSNNLTVHISQGQNSGVLGGAVVFGGSSTTYTLSGIVDKSGNFTFSVQQSAGKTPFVFHGKYSGSFLRGFYCNSSTNSCPIDIGYFTVGPRY